MVSLKVLLVLTLVVAVTCDPCHLKHPKLKKKLCDKHHKRARCGAEVAVKGGLKESCRFLFKGLKKHCNFRKNVYAELIHLRLPTDIDSSLSFLLRLGLGCGSAIDIIIPGLGDLVSRLIGLSLRNIACFRGALGHRGFCNEGDYDDFFGISFGGISSIDALFKRFKCHNARSEIEEFINKDSNGKGIDSYTGSKRIVIDIVFDILKMVEKKESKKELCKKDLTFLTDRIIALTGAIGNDFSKDFGNSFTEHAVSSLDKYLVNVGCPALSGRKDNIITTIKDSNTDNENADLPWGDLSDDGKDYSADDDDDDASLAVTVNSPLGGYFEVFFKPILKGKGRCRVSRDTLNELMSMKTPSNFVDVANFLSNLSIVLANVVDTLAYGVGNLVGRMLLFISRATLCIKNNSNDGYCSKNYVKAFGIDGSANSVADLAELYKLKDAKQQVIDLIYKHTNGKDVDQVKKGAQRVILKSCVKLAELVDNFDENSYSKSYIEMAKMMGTVANSFDEKHELGDKITSAMSSACDKYVQQKGYTAIQDRQDDIKKTTMSSKSDSTFYQSITTTTVVTITTTTESVEQSSSSVETNEVEE